MARQWSEAMTRAGRTVEVLVTVDVGFHRCGIDPDGAEAVDMIRQVASLRGLVFRGLLAHAGHTYHAHSDDAMRRMAEEEARTLRDLASSVSIGRRGDRRDHTGATPPARHAIQQDGITEFGPGNYVYFDRTQVALGAAQVDDCALTVLTRVVSKPAPDRIILDAGSKTLTNDGARGFVPAEGYGLVLRDAEGRLQPDASLVIERLSEEHATVRVMGGSTDLEPGDLVRVLPNHSCVVSNLVDQAWLVDGESVEALPIAARGCIT